MNKILIGYISIIAATILDAILPILIQGDKPDIFFYIFLLSITYIVLSFSHQEIEIKNYSKIIIEKLKNISLDIKLIKFGFLQYISYILYIFSTLYITTGTYNSLSISQIIFLTICSNRSNGTGLNMFEYIGFFIIGISLIRVVFMAIYKNGKKIDKNVLYGSFALILSLMLFQYINYYSTSFVKNPYDDNLSVSLFMAVLSFTVLVFRRLFLNIRFSFGSIQKLLYTITFPILLSNYIPNLLIFASYDYLNIIVILFFMLLQALFGFSLDKLYYKEIFTPHKINTIILLSIGTLIAIYGYYKANKTTIDKPKSDQNNKSNYVNRHLSL